MNDQASKPKENKKSVATEALEKIAGNKKETRSDKLLSLIPEGHSPKVYLDLIKNHVLGVDKQGNPRSDEDLMLFLYTAKRTGLDPLVNQVYAVFRWDNRQGKEVMTIQTGIDGMRLVAQRSGDYAGQDDAKFLPEDESAQYPIKASVTVFKMVQGTRVGFTATARWSEYVQLNKEGKPSNLWAKMPYLMLAKCAEALALRKAFPNELSGIYAKEEMDQAGSTNLLGDLPTPDKFKKEPSEPVVGHGAPDDDKRPTLHIGDRGAADKTAELKKDAQDEADTNKTSEIPVSDIPKEPLPVARKVEPTVDVAAQRQAIKERKEAENAQ